MKRYFIILLLIALQPHEFKAAASSVPSCPEIEPITYHDNNCETCNVQNAVTSFYSENNNKHRLGLQKLNDIISEDRKYKSFAQLTIARSIPDPIARWKILKPLIISKRSDSAFNLIQLDAYNLVFHGFEKSDDDEARCIAACNVYTIINNNNLPSENPYVKNSMMVALSHICDYLQKNPEKTLHSIGLDFDRTNPDTYLISTLLREKGLVCEANKLLALSVHHTPSAVNEALLIAKNTPDSEAFMLLDAAAATENADAQTAMGVFCLKKIYHKELIALEKNLFSVAKKHLAAAHKKRHPLGQLKYAQLLCEMGKTQGDFEKPIRIFTELLKNPSYEFFTEALIRLGWAERACADHISTSAQSQRIKSNRSTKHNLQAISMFEKALKHSLERGQEKLYIRAAHALIDILKKNEHLRPDLSINNIAESLYKTCPRDPRALMIYGRFQFGHNANIDLAKECFLNALHINPQKGVLHHEISAFINRLWIKQLDDHIIDFSQKALSIIPDFILAHKSLARVYQRQGLIDKAIIHFKEAVQPHDSATYFCLGCTHLLKGTLTISDFLEAKKNIKTAIKISPDQGNYWQTLSTIYIGLNQDTKAVKATMMGARKEHLLSLITLAAYRLEGTGGGYSPKSAATLYHAILSRDDFKKEFAKHITRFNIIAMCAMHQDKAFIKQMVDTDSQLNIAISDIERMAKKAVSNEARDELYHTLGILYKRAAKYESDPVKKRNLLFKAKIAFNTVHLTQGESPVNARYLYYRAKTELSCAKLLHSNIKEAAEKAKTMYEKIISDHTENNPHKYFVQNNPHNYFVMRTYYKLSKIYGDIFNNPEASEHYLKKHGQIVSEISQVFLA
jgi:tetratricopeptide (TPR) repeat protein